MCLWPQISLFFPSVCRYFLPWCSVFQIAYWTQTFKLLQNLIVAQRFVLMFSILYFQDVRYTYVHLGQTQLPSSPNMIPASASVPQPSHAHFCDSAWPLWTLSVFIVLVLSKVNVAAPSVVFWDHKHVLHSENQYRAITFHSVAFTRVRRVLNYI